MDPVSERYRSLTVFIQENKGSVNHILLGGSLGGEIICARRWGGEVGRFVLGDGLKVE